MTTTPAEVPLNFPASKFRLVGAAYIDFNLLCVVMGWVHYLAAGKWGSYYDLSFIYLVLLLLVFPLQMLLIHVFKIRSVGHMALSIFLNPKEGLPPSDPQKLLVEKEIKINENWITMAIGFILINDGCNQVIRGTLHHKVPPLFGMNLSEPWSMVVTFLLGVFCIKIGIDILRLRAWAAYGAIAYFLTLVVGVLVVYPQMADWARSQILLKESTEAKNLSASDLRSMAAMFVNSLVVVGTLLAAALFFHRSRFKKLSE